MNTSAISTAYTAGCDLRSLIKGEVFADREILDVWENIAQAIPRIYEKYSMELLRETTDLWITIRGHSFAKGFTMYFEGEYKKGTRKTLKPAVDKE